MSIVNALIPAIQHLRSNRACVGQSKAEAKPKKKDDKSTKAAKPTKARSGYGKTMGNVPGEELMEPRITLKKAR